MYKKAKKLNEEEKQKDSYNPSGDEREILEFVDKRIDSLKLYRTDVFGKNIEEG